MSDKKAKSDNSLTTGVLIIAIGVIALFATFSDITIVWHVIWKFWPVFLIIGGVSMIPMNGYIKSGIVVVIIAVSCLMYQHQVKNYSSSTRIYEYFDDDDWEISSSQNIDDTNSTARLQEFSEPYQESVSNASIEIEYGAGTMTLGDPTTELVSVTNKSNYILQSFNVSYQGDKAIVKVDSEGSIKTKGGNVSSNRFDLVLNNQPTWDFDLDIGAAKLDFDFSPYKVSDIELDGGACDIDMKIGTLQNKTKIDLETGVSNIIIRIPESAGCRIESESALSNKEFENFIKRGKGIYETSNYSDAQQVILIDLNCAVSSIKVVRY